MVYELARFLNRDAERIPRASLEKPLETEPQRDRRTRRPSFLRGARRHPARVRGGGLGAKEIGGRARARPGIFHLDRMDAGEYKRRQAPPLIKDHRQGLRPRQSIACLSLEGSIVAETLGDERYRVRREVWSLLKDLSS